MNEPLCFDTQVIVMFTLMMAWSPKNNLRELHSRNTTQIVTRTRARFISPCRLDDETFVLAFLIPLEEEKKWMSLIRLIMFKVSHKKSYLTCVEVRISEFLHNICFDFFERTKQRQPIRPETADIHFYVPIRRWDICSCFLDSPGKKWIRLIRLIKGQIKL